MKSFIAVGLLLTLMTLNSVAADEARPVSMIQLIANPDKYDGKLVVVFGYLTLAERPSLYIHREDATQALMTNALWVDSSEPMRQEMAKVSQKYVKIVGRFRAGSGGRVYFLAGGITEIEECVPWPYHPEARTSNKDRPARD